ncbi:MAG: homoserine dehydrogenase [Clostridia bacterium]|nr:homoserine dehydrogenase [Clostridia bacterium]
MQPDVQYIGLCGLGTVGSGVVRLLRQNAALLRERWGLAPQVRRILVRDPARPRAVDGVEGLLTTDPADILDDPRIHIVVEVMGGRDAARRIVLEALRRGKTVVTANKELLAYDGREVLDTADACGGEVFFEASVGGATPLIGPLRTSLAANRILLLRGILNGTTNYILTQMSQRGQTFAEALADAQAQGFAEADPTDDVDGHDATRKLVILAAVAFGTPLDPDAVHCEGIRGIHPKDIAFARELGYVIKLLATARALDNAVEARVHPVLLPFDHPLAKVDGSLNAVLAVGDFSGEVTFIGRGAGGNETASAIVADLLEAMRNRRLGVRGRSCTCHRQLPVRPMSETLARHYLRFDCEDRPGVLGQLAQVFGRHNVNLRAVIQKPSDGRADLVFLSSECRERNVRAALAELADLPHVARLANHIRCEEGPA